MEIRIPCPHCGRELKLPDRKLLGRKGKCPKCSHSFILEEPAEVQLELAEAEPSATAKAGRWTPDVTSTTPRQSARPPVGGGIDPMIPELGGNDGAAARMRALQKKNAKRRNTGLVIGAVVVLAVGGVTYYAMTHVPKKPGEIVQTEQPVDDPQAVAERVAAVSGQSHDDSDFESAASPTDGKFIELQYIPFGAQVILNIRPAELWQKESLGEELRYCLPPLAKFLESTFDDLFKRKPEQIEEAQICLIPGVQGSLPDVAAVIHLVDEAKRSDLITELGTRVDDYDHPVYISGERAYMIADQKTMAVCPRAQVKEMVDAIVGRNPASDGIDELLPKTDRDRHLTLIFVPRTIRLHSTWWFKDDVRPFILQACDWFGDEVEAAAWSFHFTEKQFYSDLILRNMGGITAPNLEREFRAKFDRLPEDVLDFVRLMDPRESGKRKIIGRLPKMTEAFAMVSNMHLSHESRSVRIITPLPDRAAPNLALGTLLAWDQSTRTDFTKERTKKPTADEPKVPDMIADRLKMKIDVDFRRAPLQDAFAFIAGEIKCTIDIDGDALKAGGFTKNMPQTFQGDKMLVQDIFVKILERYQDPQKPGNTMVIVINEDKKTILVTTLAFAEQQKLTPFNVFKK